MLLIIALYLFGVTLLIAIIYSIYQSWVIEKRARIILNNVYKGNLQNSSIERSIKAISDKVYKSKFVEININNKYETPFSNSNYTSTLNGGRKNIKWAAFIRKN